MKFQLKDIQPNPFRRVEKYPILQAKVDDLKESIQSTGFWKTVTVRIGTNKKPELVYGHHRLEALHQLFSGTHEVELNVEALTDAQMIQWMARENNESYHTNAVVVIESVRAAVQAYAEGKITLDEMPVGEDTRKGYIRYAPSFMAGVPAPPVGARPYTMDSLAKFLGMVRSGRKEPQDRFVAAFGAVELIEEGYLSETKIQGIGTKNLGIMVGSLKTQRDAAKKEQARLLEQAEKQRADAEKKRIALEKEQKAAEERRKSAMEKAKKQADQQKADQLRKAAEQAKRKADEDARAKQKEIDESKAEAKKKEETAKRDANTAKSQIKEVSEELVDKIKSGTLNRDDINAVSKDLADKQGRKVARRVTNSPSTVSSDEMDDIRKLLESMKSAASQPGMSRLRQLNLPEKVLRFAKAIVESGYRSLAREEHPDKKSGSQESMQALNAAVLWLRTSIEKEKQK